MSGNPNEPVIKCEGLGKRYYIWREPRARLSGSLARSLARSKACPSWARERLQGHYKRACREFEALRDFSMEVYRGETMGIVGRNGSGKSTLLQMLAGTLQPTSGTLEVHGRVAALLELGSGFNPNFTGKENVFLNAAVLGLSRPQIEAKFDEIAAFADIGEFIETPVNTYSSGMMLRLAFAVQTAVEPDILIIDEALAVGDETFARKCFARLERLREAGVTILFVSHSMGAVTSLCRRAIFLHRGEKVIEGTPKFVASRYQKFCHAPDDLAPTVLQGIREEALEAQREAAEEEQQARQGDRKATKDEPSGLATSSGETSTGQPHRKKPKIQVEGRSPEEAMTLSGGWFDAELISRSRVDYDQLGGEITDIRVTDLEGNTVNLLQRRRRYRLVYRVRFEQECRDVAFAMLIKTKEGLELGGTRSHPENVFVPKVAAGTEVEVRFTFVCALMPGIYFLNTGVEGTVRERRGYVHRIVDATAFRVLHDADALMTGTIDFLIQPEFETVEEVLPVAAGES